MLAQKDLISLRNRTPEERSAISRKGGQSKTFMGAVNSMSNLPWYKASGMTKEQIYFSQLLKDNRIAQCISDMLVYIATKAETAEDYHELLKHMMKLPFLAQAYRDLEKDKQRDVIPIVIEVLRDNGQERLIGELYKRLRLTGWDAGAQHNPDVELSEVRCDALSTEPQGSIVEGEVDEAVPHP